MVPAMAVFELAASGPVHRGPPRAIKRLRMSCLLQSSATITVGLEPGLELVVLAEASHLAPAIEVTASSLWNLFQLVNRDLESTAKPPRRAKVRHQEGMAGSLVALLARGSIGIRGSIGGSRRSSSQMGSIGFSLAEPLRLAMAISRAVRQVDCMRPSPRSLVGPCWHCLLPHPACSQMPSPSSPTARVPSGIQPVAKIQTRCPEVSMPFLLEVLGLEPLVECAHRPRAIVGGLWGHGSNFFHLQ